MYMYLTIGALSRALGDVGVDARTYGRDIRGRDRGPIISRGDLVPRTRDPVPRTTGRRAGRCFNATHHTIGMGKTTNEKKDHDHDKEDEPSTLGVLMSDESCQQASQFIQSKGVVSSTAASYSSAWKLWLEFHTINQSTDVFLKSIDKNDVAKSMVWTMFCMYLYDHHGRRAEQVHSVLTGVRHRLLTSFTSIQFLGSEVVANARRAVQRNPDEERAHAEAKRSKEMLPVTPDMLTHLRSYLWGVESDWSFDAILRKAVWLACCLSYDRGPRISNVTLKNGRNSLDHNIRCDSVSFLIDEDDHVCTIRAGPGMKVVAASAVASLTIDIITSKTTGGSKALKILPAVISRSTAESTQLLIDFVHFVQHSGSAGGQPLLSFYRTSPVTGHRLHKVVTRREVSSEIKECAIRCGLPARFFSATSLRKGHATQTSLSGWSAVERNLAGGWAPNSRVPDKHYDHSKRIHGALDAAASIDAQHMNIRHLRSLIPRSITDG